MTKPKPTKNVVVFDCETKTAISKAGFQALEISVAVSYSYPLDRYQVYFEKEIATLIQELKQADLVLGFNQVGFDLPLLKNYDPTFSLGPSQTYDLLKEFERVAGHRIKLDVLLQQTLGTRKSANGLQAVEWYKQGEIQKIVEYCKEDVRQTKMLFDYVVQHGTVAYESQGKKKWIQLPVPSIYEAPGTNLSLF